jgi:hypothetical protein
MPFLHKKRPLLLGRQHIEITKHTVAVTYGKAVDTIPVDRAPHCRESMPINSILRLDGAGGVVEVQCAQVLVSSRRLTKG